MARRYGYYLECYEFESIVTTLNAQQLPPDSAKIEAITQSEIFTVSRKCISLNIYMPRKDQEIVIGVN